MERKETSITIAYTPTGYHARASLSSQDDPNSEAVLDLVAKSFVGFLKSKGVSLPEPVQVQAFCTCDTHCQSILELRLNGGFFRVDFGDPSSGQPIAIHIPAQQVCGETQALQESTTPSMEERCCHSDSQHSTRKTNNPS